MCEVVRQPAVRSGTMTRSVPVSTPSCQPQPQQQLPAGFLTLTEQQYRTTVFQEPIELYYEILPVPICTGQWASVYKCLELSSGIHFAAKFCSKTRLGVDASREITHEVAAMYHARGCARVVRLHQVFETPHQLILVMELGSGGDLQGVLDNDQVPYEPDVVRFIANLLEGLAFLHDRNIAHLDIKPQNLVLTGAFPDCDIKLCDLEISRVISAGQEIREMLGTPDYVSPEILRFEPVKLSADIWSVGVLAYVLLTGFTPFGGDTDAETFRNIATAELEFPDELFEDVSGDAKDFIRRCLLKEPSGRPSPHQLLQHDWMMRRPSGGVPRLVVSQSESLNTCAQEATHDPIALRRSISKSREVLSVKVSQSHLKKNISKSRERLCDMKFTGVPMRPDQFPSCLRSSVSEVPDNRPPWKGAGVPKTSPTNVKAERVNTFKLRDEYQSQVAAGLAASRDSVDSASATSPSPFVRHGSLRGRRKTSTPDGSSTDLRASLRRGRNTESTTSRRNSCQEESKTPTEPAKKKEGPRRTQSVSDAIMSARRNRNSRNNLLLPVEENRSGSESVDVLADGQEMVRIRPGTFVIDMGEPTKPRKKKSTVEEEDKPQSEAKDVSRKNSSVEPSGRSKSSFRANPSVEIEEPAEDSSSNQTHQRQPSPDTRSISTRKLSSQPSSPLLTPRSTLERQTSPLRQASPQPRQGSPRRSRDETSPFQRSTLTRSSLRGSLRRTGAAARLSAAQDSHRPPTPASDELVHGLRKSSTDEDMRRLASEEDHVTPLESERRLQKSSTDEDVRQTGGRTPRRRSPGMSRNVSSPLLLSRSPTSDLGSSELSGEESESAPRERVCAKPETTSSVARAISRFQALEQEARQGNVSPTAARSPLISRKFSSPVLRSPDLGRKISSPALRSPDLSRKISSPALRSPELSRKTSSPALRSPCVTRKASSPALRSPCITRKASSPALGAASQRERGYLTRAPGLRAA